MQAARHNIHFAGCVCRDFYNYSTKLLYIIASFHIPLPFHRKLTAVGRATQLNVFSQLHCI